MKPQLFIIVLIKIVILYLGEVTVECVSCSGGGSEFSGVAGGNLTIRYTFKKDFAIMLITYNGTKNRIVITAALDIKPTVADKRFVIPQKFSGTGGTRSTEITLTKLSLLDDNGVAFTYQYTDLSAYQFTGSNNLKVLGRYLMISVVFCLSLIRKLNNKLNNKWRFRIKWSCWWKHNNMLHF